MLFKGPAKTSNVVAVTAGILGQTTYGNFNRMFCSKPHFYFYNDKLDKKNELNSSLANLEKSTSNIRSNTKSTSTRDGNKKPTRIGIVQHVKTKNDFLLLNFILFELNSFLLFCTKDLFFLRPFSIAISKNTKSNIKIAICAAPPRLFFPRQLI